MEDMEIKKLRRILLSNKLTDNIITYNSDNFGKTYFIPQKIEGNDVYGIFITPNLNKSINKISLASLIEKDLSISKFEKLKL
jgi:hypothetical protein